MPAKKRKRQKKTSVRDNIVRLLKATRRKGIQSLIAYLDDEGFFEMPASRSGHNDYKGGLADHSVNVTELLISFCAEIDFGRSLDPGQEPLKIKPQNLVIAGILHDLCKIGAYLPDEGDGYTQNPDRDPGHAQLSIKRITKYIKLEPIEEMMIRYHMGVYGLKEFNKKTGEYELRGGRVFLSLANVWFHNPVVKLMYFCDEFATIAEKVRASAKKRS